MKKDFTLIELLVVIAIIAILASMLLPALSQSREMGKRVVCRSNHKQLALAMCGYVDSNDGMYPLACNKEIDTNLNQWNLGTRNWDMLIAPELNIPEDPLVPVPALVCPSDDVPNHMAVGPEYVKKSYLAVTVTTTADAYWPGPGRTAVGIRTIDYGRDYRSRRIAEVNRPVEAALTSEKAHAAGVWWVGSTNWRGRGYNMGNGCGYINVTDSPHARSEDDYLAGENVSWVDGHVEWVTGKPYTWNYCPVEADGVMRW